MYANQCSGAIASPQFRFRPGAIAVTAFPQRGDAFIRAPKTGADRCSIMGAAAVMGNVWEPYLTLTVHFDLLNGAPPGRFHAGRGCVEFRARPSWMAWSWRSALPALSERPAPGHKDVHDQSYAVFRIWPAAS